MKKNTWLDRKAKSKAKGKARGIRTCQWPIGEPTDPGFDFCGREDVVEGKPYCSTHCERAYLREEEGSLR
jgi:GcrA cell cycle regulator